MIDRRALASQPTFASVPFGTGLALQRSRLRDLTHFRLKAPSLQRVGTAWVAGDVWVSVWSWVRRPC